MDVEWFVGDASSFALCECSARANGGVLALSVREPAAFPWDLIRSSVASDGADYRVWRSVRAAVVAVVADRRCWYRAHLATYPQNSAIVGVFDNGMVRQNGGKSQFSPWGTPVLRHGMARQRPSFGVLSDRFYAEEVRKTAADESLVRTRHEIDSPFRALAQRGTNADRNSIME